jgi:arylsulfatase A-like enzyme
MRPTVNLWLAMAGVSIGISLAPPAALAAKTRKPNILIIVSDDHGYADVGFHGCGDIPTPNLDSLAKSGVRFSNGYVSGPYCSPTRAGLLTGRYQQRFGHEFNPGPTESEDVGLPLSETTVADRLKSAGYVTGIIGKWHLGAAPKFHPLHRGFDEFFGFLGGAHPYFPGEGAPIYRGNEVVKEEKYLTDAFAREAVSFVERHSKDPFLLYLAFNAVHTPKHATDDRLRKFSSIKDESRRTYAAMLTALDEGVGKVLAALRSEGLEQDTLIVFFSDNGGPTMRGTTINGSRNDPLRGSKRTTLEGGIRVPFVVSWKGSLPEGVVYDQPVIQLDVLPTVLAAAGVNVESEWKLDGVNLLPYVKGEISGSPHDSLYWRLGQQTAVRRGDWKLVRYDQTADEANTKSDKPNTSSGEANTKSGEANTKSDAQTEPKVTRARLYNLARDLGEKEDLATAHPEKAEELQGLWNSWAAQLKEPLWRPARQVAHNSQKPVAGARADGPSGRPNIVVILADDLGWADVGWHGGEIRTPRLDSLAASGTKLEQFYVQPVCSPTRGALMTGRYPMRYGLQVGVVRPWAQYGLPLEERTLPQALREAGYETAICGKWHLGHVQPEYLPTHRGFEHQYGHYNGALDYFTHVRDGGFDWHRDDQACRDEGYSTHLIAREAVRRIEERDRARPLFLYVAFNAVHAPHQVPNSYKEPYTHLAEPRRTYAGMVAAMDEAVGKIVDSVERAGLRRDTLFLFSSDNGGPAPGRVTSNGPLHGQKATLYEGGVRVPAFATWQDHIEPGTLAHAPLHIVDWYPTLLKLAGATVNQPLPLDGLDAWPAITRGEPSPHKEILLNSTPGGGAIRVGDWKLVLKGPAGEGDASEGEPRSGARQAEPVRMSEELFRISDDPNEKHDLAAANPEKVKELRDRYDALALQAVEPKSAPKAPEFRSPRIWGERD